MQRSQFMNYQLQQFKSSAELAENLATYVADKLALAITANNQASLAVSGGNTPKLFFQKLSQTAIAWHLVTVTLVDDRWLPANHQDSNENLVKANLLQSNAAKAKFVSLYSAAAADAFAGEREINLRLQSALTQPLTCAILGMGGDAHSASFFPGSPELAKAFTSNDICVATTPTNANYQRMTLTLSQLAASDNLIVHFEGATKSQVWEQAVAAKNRDLTPIYAVIEQTRSNKVQVFTCNDN